MREWLAPPPPPPLLSKKTPLAASSTSVEGEEECVSPSLPLPSQRHPAMIESEPRWQKAAARCARRVLPVLFARSAWEQRTSRIYTRVEQGRHCRMLPIILGTAPEQECKEPARELHCQISRVGRASTNTHYLQSTVKKTKKLSTACKIHWLAEFIALLNSQKQKI